LIVHLPDHRHSFVADLQPTTFKMKSSVILLATSAMMAMATPVVNNREVVTDIDTVVEYQTVTVDESAAASPAPVKAADVVVTTTTTAAAQATYVNGGKHRSLEPKSSTSTPEAVATTVEQPNVVYVTETYEAPTTTTTPAAVTTTQATQAQKVYSTSSSSAQAAASSSADMATNAIYAHNIHRANHSAPEMSWLDEIAGYAQATAETCKFAHDMTQGAGNYGQNIAMWATSDNAAALGEAGAIGMATHDMWYNGEVGLYLPSYYGESTPDMTDFESWGHFSQLVWKDSTELGCYAKLCAAGTMYDDMDAWFMVCNYRPAGNVGGSYGSNVLTSLGEGTITN
jgi:uncharacterized protein YkwD